MPSSHCGAGTRGDKPSRGDEAAGASWGRPSSLSHAVLSARTAHMGASGGPPRGVALTRSWKSSKRAAMIPENAEMACFMSATSCSSASQAWKSARAPLSGPPSMRSPSPGRRSERTHCGMRSWTWSVRTLCSSEKSNTSRFKSTNFWSNSSKSSGARLGCGATFVSFCETTGETVGCTDGDVCRLKAFIRKLGRGPPTLPGTNSLSFRRISKMQNLMKTSKV
mmetsp:Transcript_4482/g.12968  ORF Transcript_4482/g.12968 Transcript_4482/m.12968 type:complete len:223 (-) Transcript_4482:1202-1870(-)